MLRKTTAIYTAAHWAVDLCCAFLVLGSRAESWLEALLLYNFCAFALQMPLGLLTDRFGNGRMFSAAGCLLVGAAACLRSVPLTMCLVAGLGNALFHVGGGRDLLQLCGGRARQLGVFVCSGAFGLFLGRLLSGTAAPWYLVCVLMALCAGAILWGCPKVAAQAFRVRADRRTLLLLPPLLAVAALRSWGGFLFSFSWKTGVWAWVLTLAVVLGKAAGGFALDRWGVRRTALSLLPAAGLFLLPEAAVSGCLAVLLFNVTMPLTLRAAADLLPGANGFSFGLMTFALFLGFLPTLLGVQTAGGGWLYAAVCLASLALLIPAMRTRQ